LDADEGKKSGRSIEVQPGMSPSSKMQEFRNAGLRPHQAALVSDMLESQIPVRRLLVAAPGLGKTVAAMALTKEIAKTNPNYRILIIGPRIMAAMYEYQLAKSLNDVNVIVLSRRILRELEAAIDQRQTIWPAPFAGVIGMDTARQEDVRNLLCSVPWDLLVVEEVHLFARSRWTLLKTILAQEAFHRVLLVTSTPELRGIASLLKGVPKTEWAATKLRDWDGKPLFYTHAPELNIIQYKRSEDEISLFKKVILLTDELLTNTIGLFVKRNLLRQAGSSPLALERGLRRLRNRLVNGPAEGRLRQRPVSSTRAIDDRMEMDAGSEAPFELARIPWRNKMVALEAITTILDQIESIHRDSKREAFEKLVVELTERAAQRMCYICVFCSFRATANYLHSVVAGNEKKAWLLTGENTPEEVNRTLDGFQRDGGILISTTVALKGFDLRQVQAFIHYDPPRSETEMRVRATRNPSAVNYLLIDNSGVWPSEWVAPGPSANVS
jgi:superfamily II DNA or RNA helicase